METHKVSEIFIGNGSALASAFTSISQNQLGIFGDSNSATVAGNTISTAGQGSLFLATLLGSDEMVKKSMEIPGTSIVSYKGQSFVPATRQVWAIGCVRGGAGSLEVSNDTIYNATIHFTNDKTWYSVRPENFRIQFTSAATATQSNIADQIVSAINSSAYGSGSTKQIKAVKVGDGTVDETNPLGLTGASNYGVEVWALDIPQFVDSTYLVRKVAFSVELDSSTGFGETSTVSQVQAVDPGVGTYEQVFLAEKFNQQYEGRLNTRLWPVVSQSFAASSSGVQSGSIAGITVTGTSGTDVIVAASGSFTAAGLVAGSKVVISGNTYEIKYLVSSTKAVLVSNLSTSPSGTAIAAKLFYDLITIEYRTLVTTSGANVGAFANKSLTIATPAIDASVTTLANPSTEGAAIVAILNPWMSSTPLAPSTISI